MISRHWTCVIHPESTDAYERHLREETFVAVREIPDFRSAAILRRETVDGMAYRIVTEWDSMDAIRAFAGDDAEEAVVPGRGPARAAPSPPPDSLRRLPRSRE